jgi:hypothetical protein
MHWFKLAGVFCFSSRVLIVELIWSARQVPLKSASFNMIPSCRTASAGKGFLATTKMSMIDRRSLLLASGATVLTRVTPVLAAQPDPALVEKVKKGVKELSRGGVNARKEGPVSNQGEEAAESDSERGSNRGTEREKDRLIGYERVVQDEMKRMQAMLILPHVQDRSAHRQSKT